MSKICFLEFEYDELVLIPMNLRFGRTSRGKCTGENERWHSGEELELESMINILGGNRDKDKCKTLGSCSRIQSVSLGQSAMKSASLSQEETRLRKRPWIWPLEDILQ